MKKAIAEDRLRLPSFDCPNATCTAKNLVFAASAETRNHAKLVPLKDVPAQVSIDFIVYCPKCKQQFAMIQNIKTTRIPFETIPLFSSMPAIIMPKRLGRRSVLHRKPKIKPDKRMRAMLSNIV